ncbi:MAG: outer membrane protein assembly factor BamA [SAR324 cluster bacterium]|nr:outer membrane protein assembly factor BamA [SAR324 cluster bacterium]
MSLILSLSLTNSVWAADTATIVDIKVEGLKLIDKGTVFGSIQSHIGGKLSGPQVARDIQALYQLGFFADIQAKIFQKSPTEIILKLVLKEKPRIHKLSVEGNNRIKDKAWEEEMRVFEKNMVNRSRVKSDLEAIKSKYREKGYLKAEFNYEITPIRDGWVNLTYKIEEAPKVYITEITITGTKYYYPLDVERIMQSAEVDCFSWVNDSGIFMENKVNSDLQIITQTYMQNGFIKVKIDKPKVTLVKSKDLYRMKIAINISEGDQYFTNKIEFSSADGYDLLFDPLEQIDELKLITTEPYNPFHQNTDRINLQQIYLEQGYAYVKVQPQTQIDEATKKVNINFAVTRKHKAYIGRVEVKGNYETKDSVVRRELKIHDNELFNGVKLRESQVAINQLGFFEPGGGVQFQQNKGDNDNQVNYDVQLQETQTGTFTASLSYSGLNGLALQFKISKKNLLGTGRTLSLSLDQQQEGNSLYNFSMQNPYFMDTNLTNEFAVYKSYTTADQYDTKSDGFNLGFSYPLWKNLYGTTRYAYKKELYENVTTIGLETLDGDEYNTYRSINMGLVYNTVNNPMFPSDGVKTTFSVEKFGGPLKGTVDYRSQSFMHSYFKSFNQDQTVVGMLKFRQSSLTKTNSEQEIPLHQRYYLGGISSIRGHEWRALKGPSSYYEGDEFNIADEYPYQGDYTSCSTDPVGDACPTSLSTTKDADRTYWEQHQGGTLYRLLNLELLFPLTREGKNVRGVIFYDLGNVWAEDRMYEIRGTTKDYNYLRKSAGLGVRFITPMGVVRFEYGTKLDKQPRETPSKFEFNISGLF